jgi:hypothetical protein
MKVCRVVTDRNSKPGISQDVQSTTPHPTRAACRTYVQSAVDVVLGDSAVLSRQHCRITYNFSTKKWQLVVEVSVFNR